jgi:hypothetical protein
MPGAWCFEGRLQARPGGASGRLARRSSRTLGAVKHLSPTMEDPRMNKILALQKLQAVSEPIEAPSNSDLSATCDGNSCISYNCGGAFAR